MRQYFEVTNPTPDPGFAPPSLRSPIAPSSQLPTREGRAAGFSQSPVGEKSFKSIQILQIYFCSICYDFFDFCATAHSYFTTTFFPPWM